MARVIRLLFLSLVLGAVCSPAHADPFTLVATVIVQGAGLTGLTALAVYAGAALLSSADARRKQRAQAAAARAQYNASLQDRNITALNAEATRKVIYGNPAPVGGALVAMFTSGDKDQYKHLVIVFAAHECLAIDEIYIEGDPLGALDGSGWVQTGSAFYESLGDRTNTENLVIDGSGNVTTSKPIGSLTWMTDPVDTTAQATGTVIASNVIAVNGGTGSVGQTLAVTYTYTETAARVNCQKHLSPAGADTADSFLISRVPDKWTTAHKLSGYTYIVLTLDLNLGRFQGGPPNVTARIRGKKSVYDFRTSSAGYTNNPALCIADYLASPYGMGATLGQIDSAAAIAAANACDAQGFTCDGVVDCGNGRDANLSALEDSMAGRSHFSGGVWRIMAGAWTSPVMTLDDTYLAGPIEVVQASNPRDQRYNGVRGQYVPASGLGVAVDVTPYNVASYLASDGAQLVRDMQFAFTGTASVCAKLAAVAVEQSRLGLTLRVPGHMGTWRLQPGDRVALNNNELGFTGKTFRMVDWTFDPNAPVGLLMTEDAAAVYTGTFNVPDYTGSSSNLQDPFARPPAPSNLVLASGTNVLLRTSDGTITTRVKATWSASVQRAVLQGGYTQVQWRLAAATDDQWVSQDLAADATSTFLTGMADRAAILVRARHISGLGVQGLWTTQGHQVLGKTVPPTAPAYVKATQTLVFWGPVADVDLAGYRIRSFPGASGAAWSRGTPLHNDLLTTGPWLITSKLYGVQTIMVVSEDTTGNQSDPVTDIVDFGPPPTSNIVQTREFPQQGYPGTRTNCTVSGTVLQADVDPTGDVYGRVDVYSEPDIYATSYKAMTWVSDRFAPRYQGGTVALAQTIAGQGALVEYQIDGSTTNDVYGLADVYAASDLYGTSSPFTTWPGALVIGRGQGIVFRVTVGSGAQQGQVTAFAPSLVMPDVRQNFGNVAVPSTGLRLTPSAGNPVLSSGWIAVNTVQVTPVVDGGGAVSGRVLDFSPTLGPATQLVDGTGTVVAGRATIDVGGLAET